MKLADLQEKIITPKKCENWRILLKKRVISSLKPQMQQKMSFSREKLQ